jgi:hypothetical protein
MGHRVLEPVQKSLDLLPDIAEQHDDEATHMPIPALASRMTPTAT